MLLDIKFKFLTNKVGTSEIQIGLYLKVKKKTIVYFLKIVSDPLSGKSFCKPKLNLKNPL